MKIFYDTEFINDGSTLELISIGMVTELGNLFYRINGDLNLQRLRTKNNWLMENVVPTLPLQVLDNDVIVWDDSHVAWPYVVKKDVLAEQVLRFIKRHMGNTDYRADLWTWEGAYDHVVLAWLFGPIGELPECLPFTSNNLAQEVRRLERYHNKRLTLPKQANDLHNALADATHLKIMYDWLANNFDEDNHV